MPKVRAAWGSPREAQSDVHQLWRLWLEPGLGVTGHPEALSKAHSNPQNICFAWRGYLCEKSSFLEFAHWDKHHSHPLLGYLEQLTSPFWASVFSSLISELASNLCSAHLPGTLWSPSVNTTKANTSCHSNSNIPNGVSTCAALWTVFCAVSVHFYGSPGRWLLASYPSYRWESSGTERLRSAPNLTQVMQLVMIGT